MSKKQQETLTQESLEVIVPRYGENKKQVDFFDKLCKTDNNKIKELMQQNKLNEFESGGYKATITTTTRQSFNEEQLLQKVKELKVKGIIKKKEYVDMDALENAIYKNQINAADLADCQITSNSLMLRIKEVKEKK